MDAWLTRWAADLKKPQSKVQSEVDTNSTLRARFLAWYNGLPDVSKNRAFAMIEIEQALKTQGKYLSPILLSEGWQRKRKWNSKGQYHRYWVPNRLT